MAVCYASNEWSGKNFAWHTIKTRLDCRLPEPHIDPRSGRAQTLQWSWAKRRRRTSAGHLCKRCEREPGFTWMRSFAPGQCRGVSFCSCTPLNVSATAFAIWPISAGLGTILSQAPRGVFNCVLGRSTRRGFRYLDTRRSSRLLCGSTRASWSIKIARTGPRPFSFGRARSAVARSGAPTTSYPRSISSARSRARGQCSGITRRILVGGIDPYS